MDFVRNPHLTYMCYILYIIHTSLTSAIWSILLVVLLYWKFKPNSLIHWCGHSWKVNVQVVKTSHAWQRNERITITYMRLDTVLSHLSPPHTVTSSFLGSVSTLRFYSCLGVPNSTGLSSLPTKIFYVLSNSPFLYHMPISFHCPYWMSCLTQIVIGVVIWQNIYFLK